MGLHSHKAAADHFSSIPLASIRKMIKLMMEVAQPSETCTFEPFIRDGSWEF
jgi:hypothetical protein